MKLDINPNDLAVVDKALQQLPWGEVNGTILRISQAIREAQGVEKPKAPEPVADSE